MNSTLKYICLALVLATLGGLWYASAISEMPPTEKAAAIPAVPHGAQVITLGIGCFWRGEAVFKQIPGVLSVTVGYMGGAPSRTEVSRIVFDPTRTSLEKILRVFWAAHRPTQSNSISGRSVIFYHTPEQRPIVQKSMTEAARSFFQPIVTQILPAEEFFAAEESQQDYYGKSGRQCSVAVSPQLEALGIK